jgi:hypothetical protein
MLDQHQGSALGTFDLPAPGTLSCTQKAQNNICRMNETLNEDADG